VYLVVREILSEDLASGSQWHRKVSAPGTHRARGVVRPEPRNSAFTLLSGSSATTRSNPHASLRTSYPIWTYLSCADDCSKSRRFAPLECSAILLLVLTGWSVVNLDPVQGQLHKSRRASRTASSWQSGRAVPPCTTGGAWRSQRAPAVRQRATAPADLGGHPATAFASPSSSAPRTQTASAGGSVGGNNRCLGELQ